MNDKTAIEKAIEAVDQRSNDKRFKSGITTFLFIFVEDGLILKLNILAALDAPGEDAQRLRVKRDCVGMEHDHDYQRRGIAPLHRA